MTMRIEGNHEPKDGFLLPQVMAVLRLGGGSV
jgi:hypothetical protein